MYNADIHHRRSIRLRDYDYSRAGAYFVTVCTWQKECIFGEVVNGVMMPNEYGRVVSSHWNEIPRHYDVAGCDQFVVMPNHFHGIVMIDDGNVGAIHELPLHNLSGIENRIVRRRMSLPRIVGRFKMNVSKQINTTRNTPGRPLWQRNYFEHIIRSEDELRRIRQYIAENPFRWAEDGDNPINLRSGAKCGNLNVLNKVPKEVSI